MVELHDQIKVVHQVAAEYWHQKAEYLFKEFDAIKIIKRTGGKVSGFLPAHDGFPSVFFKVYFYDRGFNFEVNGLSAARSMQQVEGVRIPDVISILPDKKAILQQRRTWEDTSSEYKRFFVNSLGFDWEKIGTWLRCFHDSRTCNENNEYFIRKKTEKFDEHLAALESLFSTQQQNSMKKIRDNAREYLSTAKTEWVISHGDFGLDNIKKAGHLLEVIDFEDCQMAPREFDVLNFLTRLDYTGSFPHSKQKYHQICHRFMEGYGMDMPATPVYNFLYLLIKLDTIETYNRRRKNQIIQGVKKPMFWLFEKISKAQLDLWLTRFLGN